jgi:serralysin
LNSVTHNWYTISFGSSFTQAPRFVASLGTYYGQDSAHLRYQDLTAGDVEVKVEEDTTEDQETNHTTEVVHFLAIVGDGTLQGEAYETETKYYYHGGQRVAMRRDNVTS